MPGFFFFQKKHILNPEITHWRNSMQNSRGQLKNSHKSNISWGWFSEKHIILNPTPPPPPPPTPTHPRPILDFTGIAHQYQDRKNINQNQMKNACPFYNAFQVLKLLLIKICKIQPTIFYFLLFLLAFICCYYLLVVFISFYMRWYHFSLIFRTLFNIYW